MVSLICTGLPRTVPPHFGRGLLKIEDVSTSCTIKVSSLVALDIKMSPLSVKETTKDEMYLKVGS